jgi:hypothetical protein
MATVVRRSLMLGTLGRLLRHRAFVIGAVLFGAMVLMAAARAPGWAVATPTSWRCVSVSSHLRWTICSAPTTWAARCSAA